MASHPTFVAVRATNGKLYAKDGRLSFLASLFILNVDSIHYEIVILLFNNYISCRIVFDIPSP